MKKYLCIEWPDDRADQGPDWMTAEKVADYIRYDYDGEPTEYKVTEIQLHCGHSIDAIDPANFCRMCKKDGMEYGLACPVCGHTVEDADYWDDESSKCLRCALEDECAEPPA